MFDVITFNIQRHTKKEGVKHTIDAINSLRNSYPNVLLCLQEVSSEVGFILEKHHHVKSDENMIIAPPGS